MKIKPAFKPGEVVMQLNRRDDLMLEDSLAESERAPFKLKEILVPVDFSEPSAKALQYAIPFAEKFGARITLLHVLEPRIYPEDTIVPPDIEAIQPTCLRKTRQELEELRRKKLQPEVDSKSIVLVGVPHQQIVECARFSKADLIIIATRGRSGFKHFVLGSTAERVVRHAPCPVLTVREDERDFV